MAHHTASSSRTRPAPTSIISAQEPKELNDHIHELYKPENGEPSMEILFFHGLQFGHCPDAYLSTWRTGGASQEVWPATWLAEEFRQAHIFSISYDGSMRKTQTCGRFDLHNLAENLVHAIIRLEGIGQGFRRPVIFVGHCFGGLVIKELCVRAENTRNLRQDSEENHKILKFLNNIGGVFFYGTPHRGSHLADKASYFLNGPLLDYVKSLSAQSARLEQDFVSVCTKYEISDLASVGESQDTSWGLFHGMVVPEASARYGGDFCTVAADHISICKPVKKTSNSFKSLIRFIQSIIPKVQGEACFEKIQPRVPKAAVGLDEGVEMVHETLQRNGVTKVGIAGMGGIGKTTLARALFNRWGPTFEYTCFVAEVKLITGPGEEVKKELWKRMHCDGKKVANLNNENWSQLRGKKLLLILDDLATDTERDLDVCSDIAEDVGPEGRFIVTSRDRELLKKMDYIHDVLFLNEKNAEQLFMTHAFLGQAEPPAPFAQIVESIVKKCDGLPLTLEVVGKYLNGKEKVEFWKQFLRCLNDADKGPGLDKKLWAKLKLSYDGLEKKEQMMFLDVTTFFSSNTDCTYWTLSEAKAAWSVIYGAEDVRWQTLVDRSLVYGGEEHHPIKVHEQLQSLGRKIALDDNKDSTWIRLLFKTAEGWKLLQPVDGVDNQEIPSFLLSSLDGDHAKITSSGLIRLKELQYLDIIIDENYKARDSKGRQGKKLLPTELVLLRSPAFQFGQVVFDPTLLPRLAVLKLSLPDDVHCLPHSIGHLSSLKILSILARNLEALPDGIGHLSLLERLIIQESIDDISQSVKDRALLTLPETFGHLSNLKHLEFSLCSGLRTLPKSFGQLSMLQSLEFWQCRSLRILPKSFGQLSALQNLSFDGCHSLHSIPKAFGRLYELKQLRFESCPFQTLPRSFGRLCQLEYLDFASCKQLQTLPESMGQLSALQNLSFDGCHSLHSIPKSFGRLYELKQLRFESCPFQTLPRSFGRLCQLEYLDFASCKQLQTLPESMGQLSALNHLSFAFCDKLHIVPGFIGRLVNLENLEFHCCPKIDRLLFGLGQQSPLRHLISDGTACISISGDGIECLTTLPYVIPAVRPGLPFSRTMYKLIKKKLVRSISFSLATEWQGCEECRSCTVVVTPYGLLSSVQELSETGEPNQFIYSLEEVCTMYHRKRGANEILCTRKDYE